MTPSSPDGTPAGGEHPGRVCFVTGKLAEAALRSTLQAMAPSFSYDVVVLKITVAALMTTPWIARFLRVPAGTELVLLPGLCEGDVAIVRDAVGVEVRKGPKDLREIPEYFGRAGLERTYGAYDIEIVAEINNAPRLSREAIRHEASYFVSCGADIVDVGCTPGLPFPALGEVVRELRALGMRVSVDTFDHAEIRAAVEAGAELVLSINASNVAIARELAAHGARAVVVPDSGDALGTIEPTIEALEAAGVRYLIDPVIEPIGIGFAASLARYAEARRRYPSAEMMMGIGNITELTAADSTGVNAVLVGLCAELGVRTVLTTEVIPWARGAVREIDIARRLMHYAVTHGVLPKRVDDRLVTVKDPMVLSYSEPELRILQSQITDANYRIFADRHGITILNADRFVRGTNIQELFAALEVDEPTHAFYLGKELMKASLALALGKTYRQEGQLSWGYLTPPDEAQRDRVRLTQRRKGGGSPSQAAGVAGPQSDGSASAGRSSD